MLYVCPLVRQVRTCGPPVEGQVVQQDPLLHGTMRLVTTPMIQTPVSLAKLVDITHRQRHIKYFKIEFSLLFILLRLAYVLNFFQHLYQYETKPVMEDKARINLISPQYVLFQYFQNFAEVPWIRSQRQNRREDQLMFALHSCFVLQSFYFLFMFCANNINHSTKHY